MEDIVRAVSGKMLDALAVAGTSGGCRRKVAELKGLTDAVALYGPTNSLPGERIVEIHLSILDAFKAGSMGGNMIIVLIKAMPLDYCVQRLPLGSIPIYGVVPARIANSYPQDYELGIRYP